MNTSTSPLGHRVAQTGFWFGSLTSVATNVLHTYLPTVHMPSGLALVIAARFGSAIWPIGLLLSIEVLARVSWRRGLGWTIARFGGAGTVAFGSAVISYSHVRDVLLAWGYGHPAAEVGPLTLDGLMVVCGFALLSLTPVQVTEQATTEVADQPRVLIRDPNPTPTREIALTTQIEALPIPTDPVVAAVATVSGHADHAVPQADRGAAEVDSPAEVLATEPRRADTEPDVRRERARALHSRGWTHGRIAAELRVSKRTVRRYLSNLLDTTGTADTVIANPADTTATSELAESDFDWLSTLNTNHHDEHEGALS
ncbi:helix-turn-helix domain-containing protein [Nocardia sp. CDC153]|uniref:helix-turn-helix domain-containing protein n=1 Tax=Nocardia sp. CDC153 TaxID=3112167 RepID=UPI002DB9D96D|nr:helix-turn-helix domain-containing protein [Nocardia sp. CDC153]MEC3953796.1 helix-turn-helix domain-containing protein [Nocardia sp. CDC153]